MSPNVSKRPPGHVRKRPVLEDFQKRHYVWRRVLPPIYMLPIIDQSHNSSTELKYYSKFILLVSVTNNNNSREPATPIILSLII